MLNIVNATYGRWGEQAQKLCLAVPQLVHLRRCMDDVTTKLQQLCNNKKDCYPNELHYQLLKDGKCWSDDSAWIRYYFTVQFECVEGSMFFLYIYMIWIIYYFYGLQNFYIGTWDFPKKFYTLGWRVDLPDFQLVLLRPPPFWKSNVDTLLNFIDPYSTHWNFVLTIYIININFFFSEKVR